MPDQVAFTAERREITGKAVKRLRRQGIVPAHVYGPGRPSLSIQINGHDIERFLATHTRTAVLRLVLGGADGQENVVVAHVQHQPATNAIQHVDFLQVNLNQPIKARVPVRLVGEAPAMKIGGSVMLHLLDAVEVEARPMDLPDALELDISGLEELKSARHVGDLAVPPGVTVLTDAAEPVIKIEPSKLTLIEEAATAAEQAEAPEQPAAEQEAPEAAEAE
ncbi:MAG TPA: 50S ribosomal protein L25 [Ktedonobacterales bacterium]|nr:50S ribosomal protein L25 [Ktedonobacterales bacterium]